MDGYDEWDEPPNIRDGIDINNESTNKHIELDFYIGENVKHNYGTFETNYITVYYYILFPPEHVQQVPLSCVIVYM